MGTIVRSGRDRGARGQAEVRHVPSALARGRGHGRRGLALTALLVASSGAAGPVGAAPSGGSPAPSPGYYDFGLATRTFTSPLFDTRTSGLLRFFARQDLPGSGSVGAWVHAGFPDYEPWFGVLGEAIPAGSWDLGFAAGDFPLAAPQPEELGIGLTDAYPVRGVSVGLQREALGWGVFAGRARYTLAVPGFEASRSTLWGGEVHGRWKHSFLGAGLTVVDDAIYVDPSRDGTAAAVMSGRIVRRLGPRRHFFGEVFATADVDLGGRAGAAWSFQAGDLSAALYGFGEGFPLAYPLYRPGEHGVEVRGRVRPTPRIGFSGNLRWITEDALRDRREIRGSVALDLQQVGNRPAVGLVYSRDDLVEQLLSVDDVSSVADRLAVTVSHHATHGLIAGTLEHVSQTGEGALDRSQALLMFRRSVGVRGLIDGNAVLQRDEAANTGMTVESALERPLRGRYYWLVGMGAALVHRQEASGEGVLRLGGSRRVGHDGWYARAELRVPFEIGLERTNLNRQVVALDLGNRFDWSDLEELRSRLPGGGPPTGVVEGRVELGGQGLRGLQVLLDGEPRAVTDADGSYRIRSVPAGLRQVAIDLRSLEPGYEIDGDSSRAVSVDKGAKARADFSVARFSSLQGAVVVCARGGRAGAVRIELTLTGNGLEWSATTTNLGGFSFTRVPPGIYELSLPPVPGGAARPEPVRVDLGRDVFGLVLELGCEDPVETPSLPEPQSSTRLTTENRNDK